VISRSAFDLDAVLHTLISTAVRLCNADHGEIFRRDGDVYRWQSSQMELFLDYLEHEQRAEIRAGRGTLIGRVALEGRAVQIADAWSDPEYEEKEAAHVGQVRAMLGVPLLRDGEPIGAFALGRSQPVPYTQREVELVITFADQAVITIENVRLFDEVRARTHELGRSLDDLRGARDRLIQTEKLASLGQFTAGIAHEIKNPLNFVNNFADLTRDLLDELEEVIDRASLEDETRSCIGELAGTMKNNLEKVAQHGRRADSIVKNMLLHSRQGGGERRDVDLNVAVEESLNLAYHGARAEKPGFDIALVKDFDLAVGKVNIYPQEFNRVLLNLVSNGFHAAHAKRANGGDPEYVPSDPDLPTSQWWRNMEGQTVPRAHRANASQFRRLASLVHLPGGRLRPEGGDPLRRQHLRLSTLPSVRLCQFARRCRRTEYRQADRLRARLGWSPAS